jgi:hypothetical protein
MEYIWISNFQYVVRDCFYFSTIHYPMLSCSFREMEDSSSSCNDNDNGYRGDDDSSTENGSRSRTYKNVTPEDSQVGGHNKGHKDLGSASSENMSEVCWLFF